MIMMCQQKSTISSDLSDEKNVETQHGTSLQHRASVQLEQSLMNNILSLILTSGIIVILVTLRATHKLANAEAKAAGFLGCCLQAWWLSFHAEYAEYAEKNSHNSAYSA